MLAHCRSKTRLTFGPIGIIIFVVLILSIFIFFFFIFFWSSNFWPVKNRNKQMVCLISNHLDIQILASLSLYKLKNLSFGQFWFIFIGHNLQLLEIFCKENGEKVFFLCLDFGKTTKRGPLYEKRAICQRYIFFFNNCKPDY